LPTINPTLPNDGEGADAADVTVPILAILAVLNGGLDSANLADSAVTTAKVADDAVTDTKVADSAVAGWKAIATTPTTVTPLGQKSYTVLFPNVDLTSKLSKGMRFKAVRTAAAPTQCTTLNGTTQYYSKSSPAGMTFTNNFVASAWIKISSYAIGTVISRFDGTSGWVFRVGSDGRVELFGTNAGSGNFKDVISYASLPLDRWVHVAVQLDMSSATCSPTVNYVMFDGVDVPCVQTQGGTNPTTLIQAGSLQVGAANGATFFGGKLAQVAVYSAKVTQATILASINQGLTGSETNLISAYSFSNSINDLNTGNANNLTANGSAVATTADSPFAQGSTTGLIEYGIIMNVAFSTNTTLTVQVPEGSALPSSGGISAASYATVSTPFGFPRNKDKWVIRIISLTSPGNITIGGINTWWAGQLSFTVPMGAWKVGYQGTFRFDSTVSGTRSGFVTLAPSAPASADWSGLLVGRLVQAACTFVICGCNRSDDRVLAAAAVYTIYVSIDAATGTETAAIGSNQGGTLLYAENAYL
jgi:hypothetical protein